MQQYDSLALSTRSGRANTRLGYRQWTPSQEDSVQLTAIYHGVAAVVFAAQTIALSVLASESPYWAPVCEAESVRPSGVAIVFARPSALPLHVITPLFLAAAAVDHAICFYGSKSWYRPLMIEGRGWVCWIEYAVSAALMNVSIASLCGVCSVIVLSLVALCTSLMMLFGYLGERLAARQTRDKELEWIAFAAGSLLFLFAWLAPTEAFFRAVHEGGVPGFVVAIFLTMFVAEGAFGVNALAWVEADSPVSPSETLKRNLDYERRKILLSLVSKTLLAWLQYGGVFAATTSP